MCALKSFKFSETRVTSVNWHRKIWHRNFLETWMCPLTSFKSSQARVTSSNWLHVTPQHCSSHAATMQAQSQMKVRLMHWLHFWADLSMHLYYVHLQNYLKKFLPHKRHIISWCKTYTAFVRFVQHGKPRHIQHSLAVYQLARPRLRLGLAQLINCSGMLDMTRFAMSHSLLSAVYINITVSCTTRNVIEGTSKSI